MTKNKFNKLQIGDRVMLTEHREAYGSFPTVDGRAYIPAAALGVVGAVKVPTTMGKNGVAKFFVCVDFPAEQKLVDYRGFTIDYENPHRNTYRTSAYAHEINA